MLLDHRVEASDSQVDGTLQGKMTGYRWHIVGSDVDIRFKVRLLNIVHPGRSDVLHDGKGHRDGHDLEGQAAAAHEERADVLPGLLATLRGHGGPVRAGHRRREVSQEGGLGVLPGESGSHMFVLVIPGASVVFQGGGERDQLVSINHVVRGAVGVVVLEEGPRRGGVVGLGSEDGELEPREVDIRGCGSARVGSSLGHDERIGGGPGVSLFTNCSDSGKLIN